MFNLYLVPDNLDEKTLTIEPRDDFYASTLKDWTSKWATDKDLLIQPMGKLDAKEYLFTYKQGKDYLSEDYNQAYGEVYGQRKIEVDNDFVRGTKKIEPIFKETVNAGTLSSNRVIPSIFKIDSNNNKTSITDGIRILQYGGLKDSSPSWQYLDGFNVYNQTQYPYSGTLDDIESPTVDINFGAVNKIYYGVNPYLLSLSYTNSNLYLNYWQKYIEEITDRDSKVVTLYLQLNPVDIMELDFSLTYVIDTHHLRLNKIVDYNPVTPSLTRCEFIKIKESTATSGVTEEITGGINTAIGAELNPRLDVPNPRGNNITP